MAYISVVLMLALCSMSKQHDLLSGINSVIPEGEYIGILRVRCPPCHPTNIVKARKGYKSDF